jgi:hypothetical protein
LDRVKNEEKSGKIRGLSKKFMDRVKNLWIESWPVFQYPLGYFPISLPIPIPIGYPLQSDTTKTKKTSPYAPSNRI